MYNGLELFSFIRRGDCVTGLSYSVSSIGSFFRRKKLNNSSPLHNHCDVSIYSFNSILQQSVVARKDIHCLVIWRFGQIRPNAPHRRSPEIGIYIPLNKRQQIFKFINLHHRYIQLSCFSFVAKTLILARNSGT